MFPVIVISCILFLAEHLPLEQGLRPAVYIVKHEECSLAEHLPLKQGC